MIIIVECKKCGIKNLDNAQYCQECGENLKKKESSSSTTTLILVGILIVVLIFIVIILHDNLIV